MSFEQLLERQLEDALPLQREEGRDWDDVLERAGHRRRRPRRWLVVAVVLVVLGVPSAYTAAPGVIGYFDDDGEPVDTASLHRRDRFVIDRMGNGAALVALEEIGNDGRRAYYKLEYDDGKLCLASGRAGAVLRFGQAECANAPDGRPVVPTPERPITADVVVQATRDDPTARVWRVTGLAGEGVARVVLRDDAGGEVAADVHGNVYTLTDLPRRRYVELVAYDADGEPVYRERVSP
ncbi:MAG: hypothetical protein ICV64_11125 [Thermoleophilia bacterium]|nr:hypothetical protein [Thermoleophilia bacterium]